MAIGGNVEEFDTWLCEKLQSYETDESVFSSYIRGILEGEDSVEEKTEALDSILSEITESDVAKLCEEILEKWKLLNASVENAEGSVLKVAEDVDVKLARLMESQASATTVRCNEYTDEEKRIREAILKQYGQYSDEEGDENESSPSQTSSAATKSASTTSGGPVKVGLERNNNAALVAQAVREKREQSKIESQKKKEKDKEDREKQKQMQADKKEKRKTQKGERRR